MKIEDRIKENRVTFINLNIGDCFYYSGDYYIKTEEKHISDGGKLTAVSLKSGLYYHFIDNEYVIKLKAKVVIGDD